MINGILVFYISPPWHYLISKVNPLIKQPHFAIIMEMNFFRLNLARTKPYLTETKTYVNLERREMEARRILDSNRVLIVTGQIGEGKTTFCKEIIKKDPSEKKIKLDINHVDLQCLEEICRDATRSIFMYFEDILGVAHYNKLHSKDKQILFNDICHNMNRWPNLRIVCCVRSTVLEMALTELDEITRTLIERCTMDLTKTWRLNKEETKRIFEKYEANYPDTKVSRIEKEKVLQYVGKEDSNVECFVGFPQCCVMCFEHQQGINVFFEPQEQLMHEIQCLMETEPESFYKLVYILCKNDALDFRRIDTVMLKKICQDENVCNKITSIQLASDFKFLNQTEGDVYMFQHQFIKEATLNVFGKDHSDIILNHAANEVIIELVRPSTFKPRSRFDCFFQVPSKHDALLAKRLVNIYNIRNILMHETCKDSAFVSRHLLPAFENGMQAHLRKREEEIESKSFKIQTIEHLIKQAQREENQQFLECLLERYSDGTKEDSVTSEFKNLFKALGIVPRDKTRA